MDYDENDFQSQNLHLAGDASNKYPPVLQPYALSKFDFDDSLNGHLRFDGLVETEGFLGIEGNEDNHWIEDFSRGSSGVVFSSSAAESCAISRHNNVWSEATSSESVEMLLNSVGQEEVITREITAKESDNCDELGCLIKQMEPSQKCDESSISMEETTNLEPIPSADKIPRDSSGLKEDVGGEQPMVRDTSQTGEHESPVEDKSSILDPSIVELDMADKAEVTLNLQNESGGAEQNPFDPEKIGIEVSESLGKREQEDSSGSGMQVDGIDPTVQHMIAGSSELNNQNALLLKIDTIDVLRNSDCNSKREGLLSEDPSKDGKSVAVEAHFDNPICSADKKEYMEEENAGHIAKPDAKGQSDFHVGEVGCRDSEVLAKGIGHNVSGLCSESVALGSDFHISSTRASSSIEPAVASAEKVACGESSSTDEKVDLQSQWQHTEFVESKPEASLSSAEEESKPSEVKVDKGMGGREGGSFSSNLVHSSSELLSETHGIGASEGVCGALTDSIDGSTKIDDIDEVARSSDINEGSSHVSIAAKQSTESASDCHTMDQNAGGSLAVDKGVVSESFRTGSGGSVGKLAESKSQSDAIAGDKTGAVIVQQELQTFPLHAEEFKHTDKEEATAARISSSGDLSIQKTPSDATTEQIPVSESEKGVSSDTSGQLLFEKSDRTVSFVDTCTGSQTDQQPAKLNEDAKVSTHNIEVHAGAGEWTETEVVGDGGQVIPQKSEDAISKDNHEKDSIVTETEPIPDESIVTRPEGVTLDKPGNDILKNGQNDKNTTSSGDNVNAQVVIPSTKSDALKILGSSSASTFSESLVKSHVRHSGKDVTDLEDPSSPFPTVTRTSELAQTETGIDSVKKPKDQNITSPILADSQNPKRNDASGFERSLTFDGSPSADLSMKKAGKKKSQPVAHVQVSIVSPIVGGFPSTFNLEKTDTRTSKGTPERKTRRSAKASGKEASKKGNAAKETPPSRQLQSGSKIGIVTLSTPSTGQIAQSIEKQQYAHVDMKPFGTFSTSVSSLPDLNSSALSSVFQRPFTDLQQVQLRAQIFVYGSLIQGIAPDEAYMISAFGGPDGGKIMWENAWRVCVERTQKPHFVTLETPLQSRSGARAPDQTMKGALQGKYASPLVGQTISRDASAVNLLPLSSPLWSIPTSRDALQSSNMSRGAVTDHQQVLSSLNPHQTPPAKNILGHNTPWISPHPYHSPWVASQQTSAFDAGARFSVFPITEAVKLTPVKESSLPQSSAKHLPKDPIVQSGTSNSAIVGIPVVDTKNVILSPAQQSTDTKSRKRKKMPVSEEPSQIILHSLSQTEQVSAPVVTRHVPTSVSITTTPAMPVSKASQEKFVTSLTPSILTGHLTSGNLETEQRSVLSGETLGKLKEARMHAEDASALAAAAVSHSQYIWKQIDQQKNSGLETEAQNRVASAAVAIAAAAAVARAAAAAANVASHAAIQAKVMAEEALASNTNISDGIRAFVQATPASILKGDGSTVGSSPVLVATREAARKRVEAATFAANRAENMDAIVKAAELAAEAVSQAGKLVTMGDPLPLNELLETGPNNCWKHIQSPHELEPSKGGSLDKKGSQATSSHGFSASPRDILTELDEHVRLLDGVSGSVSAAGKKMKGQSHKGADLAKTVTVVTEPEALSKSSIDSETEGEQVAEALKENGIREGSHVEIFKEGAGLRKAWYSANVLSLKDGKAYVSYSDLSSGQGAEKLKEWVSLEGEKDDTPRIRTARPITAMPFEGTRKRRRAAIGDYTWAVGNRVDAWVHDSWWEGFITEKNKKDETTLTVHFPAQEETLAVKAWHLRPSLVWRYGKWIECSSSGGNNSSSHEGDTPNEKRPRLGIPAGEVEGKDKSLKNVDLLGSRKPNQPGLLDLAASDKTFNIGRSTRDENNLDPLRMKRTGLQKQGSRGIFGVPKPGKKRKFMEVSKHYVSGPGIKTSEPNDSVKFTKYLMPQSSGSRGWKNTSRSEPKEKQAAVSKSKFFKPVSKPKEKPNASVRTIPQKEDLQITAGSGMDADATTNQTAENKEFVCHNPMEIQSISISREATEDETSLSSHVVSADAPSSKKTSSLSTKVERASKGKLAFAAARLTKIEENKVLNENSAKSTSDVMEPRRSNRRIQPTSRLLEGLQTSLIISKIPSVAHGKGHQSQNKSSSRGK